MRLPWWVPFAFALVAAVAIAAWQGAERERGTLKTALALAEAKADSLARRRAVADTVYRTATRTLTRALVTVDTLRDSLTITDTVEVVRFIAAQDTALAACRAVITSCEVRVALADSLTKNAENRLMITQRLVGAPRTAVGIAWDATTGHLGVMADRDFGRLRAGATATPGSVELRLAWWW